jgi:hypothetical protein
MCRPSIDRNKPTESLLEGPGKAVKQDDHLLFFMYSIVTYDCVQPDTQFALTFVCESPVGSY